jgi:hypothetical protein
MKSPSLDTFATTPISMKTMKTNASAKLLNEPRGIRDWTMLAFLLAPLSMTGMGRAQVTNIIYQDNFARTGALDGSAPDTVNAPGASWFACNVPGLNAQVQTDGSSIALTNSPNPVNGFYLNGFLPFKPQLGHIYYLNCNIKPTAGGTNWLSFGFASHALSNIFYHTYMVGAGSLGVRGNGLQWSTWGALAGFSNFTNTIGNNFQSFTVALDLTLGNANYGGQIRFYTNNVLVTGGNQTMSLETTARASCPRLSVNCPTKWCWEPRL